MQWPDLVVASSHALVDFLQLGVVRPQELEGLGHGRHGGGGGPDLPAELLQGRAVKRGVLLLETDRGQGQRRQGTWTEQGRRKQGRAVNHEKERENNNDGTNCHLPTGL